MVETVRGSKVTVALEVEPGMRSAEDPDHPQADVRSSKICVRSEARSACYDILVEGRRFPLEPACSPVKRLGASAAVGWFICTAEAEPVLSRQDRALVLLALKAPLDLVDELPPVILSEQSEYVVWNDRALSPMPIVTTADYLLNQGETHFGPHFYRVKTYVYDKSKGQYILADSYTTERRYAGLDEVAQLGVIKAEDRAIRSHLKARPK